MDGRLFESLSCWPNLGNTRPAIPITLATLDGRRVVENEAMPIDTGYTGAMLLSHETFSYFEKAELPETESHIYRTLTGSIPMRTARALLILPLGDEMEIFVDTPKYGSGKSLVGLRAVSGIDVLLRGQNSETCLLKERTQ